MDRGLDGGSLVATQEKLGHAGMDELRRWYQTEVFAATDTQQQRWEERRWAFLGQLQQPRCFKNKLALVPSCHFGDVRHALRNPLTHTV